MTDIEKNGYMELRLPNSRDVTNITGLHTNNNTLENELLEKWSTKKQKSETLSNVYSGLKVLTKNPIYNRRPDAVRNCGSYLEFYVNPSDRTDKKLKRAYFCKDRLCPMCNWRRSLKIFGQVSKIFDYIDHEYNNHYDYLFLTLTIKNVDFNDLDSGIKVIQKGLRYLTHKCNYFKDICYGTFSTIEITFNNKSNTWHPHVHLIVLVNKSYFKSRNYISASKWSEIWMNCCDLDYEPIINIQKVKKLSNGIAEVSKYMAKDSDYLGDDDYSLVLKKVNILAKSIRSKRLTSKTGLIKEVHCLLNLDDSEDGDLISTDQEDLNPNIAYVIEKYNWRSGIYLRSN